LELDQLIRFQRAAGLPAVDDPDARVFMQLGIDPDLMLNIVRVLAQGLTNASEVMNTAALSAVLRPGVSELDIAKGTDALVSAAAPLLGPMIDDLLLLQLRRTLETEAVNADERAAGTPRPEAKLIGAAFADLVRLHRAGGGAAPGATRATRQPAGGTGPRRRQTAGAVHQDHRRCGDVRVGRARRAARRRAGTP
jgi:adenylate cyclase